MTIDISQSTMKNSFRRSTVALTLKEGLRRTLSSTYLRNRCSMPVRSRQRTGSITFPHVGFEWMVMGATLTTQTQYSV